MFRYDMSTSISKILAKSELRNALMDEWPSLEATNINAIEDEAELVGAVANCAGRTPIEATELVRNWLERQNIAPIDIKADRLRDRGNENWENEGGSSPLPN